MGSAASRSRRQKNSEVGAVAVATVILILVILATQHYPADDVTVNAKGISIVSVKQVAAASMFAYAKSLLLTNSSGRVDLILPVAASECGVLRDQAKLTCDDSGAHSQRPIRATWTAVRQLEVRNASGSEVALAAMPAQRGGGVSFSVTGRQPLRLCVGPAADSAPLTLRVGSTDVTFPPGSPEASICEGLLVSFQSSSGGAISSGSATSGFILQGIDYVETDLTGKEVTLSADAVRLTARSTATDSNYDGALMDIASDRLFQFAATGVPPDLVARNQLVNGATTVTEADVERLPNYYNHFTWLSYLLTLVGAVISLLVWRLGW